jgi:hypothetical protein
MKKLVAAAVLMLAVFGLVVTTVTVVSLSTTTAEAAPCRCPLIYAPVICDNGKTYPNQCVADCHHAKNCVPTGEL